MTLKISRVRVRMGSVQLPDRKLKDGEVTEDIIDVPLRPGERIMQFDLEKQFGYGIVPRSSGGWDTTRDKSADTWRYRAVTVEEIDYEPGEGDQQEEVADVEVVGELEQGESHEQ